MARWAKYNAFVFVIGLGILGRIVQTYNLKNAKGDIVFKGEQYRNGIYYSTLLVDGAVIKSKTMVLEH